MVKPSLFIDSRKFSAASSKVSDATFDTYSLAVTKGAFKVVYFDYYYHPRYSRMFLLNDFQFLNFIVAKFVNWVVLK